MFKIPDRVADLFGDQAARVEFQRALLAVGQAQHYEMTYLEDGPFSEAARITHGRLHSVDVNSLPEEQRELVAGAKALSHRLITSGYAIHEAAKVNELAAEDWSELLAFTREKCEGSARIADNKGWERCYTYILDRAEAALSPDRSDEDRDAGYAVLRHFASFYGTDSSFKRRWYLQVA
ncbi:hypothetical protein [Streptomyces sp. B1I3]|uniref:hypothetical protein n=1 Tax=Streptomyces sp. B1I3 TaxID=3042264 RepID=UPI0027826D02|nr:hypothetical protein [Streptomyces sp. B1I3]MDQ0791946.1 hypothetical protein [Streptomyces sp. B1I3]